MISKNDPSIVVPATIVNRWTVHRCVTIASLLLPTALCCGTTGYAEVHHASDLGWQEGQDITAQFDALIRDKQIGDGDELVLDHAYRIGGTHTLPDDFTLSATVGGGLDVIDATSTNNAPLLLLGNRNVLCNLTIRYLETPDPSPHAGTHPARGVHFHPRVGIQTNDVDRVQIKQCRMLGSIRHHLKLTQCTHPEVVGCHIEGGFWTVYLTGVQDAVFRHCVIEKCQGDAIKTGRGNGPSGVQRALVENCVFQDCGRDGIDTTGGWADSVVRNTTFRRLFSGMDIKSYFEKPEHLKQDCKNTGILIERCRFTDMANCVTFSTLDRGVAVCGEYFLDAVTAQQYAPHDVDVNDCIFERTDDASVRMLLLKGGHSIRYRNAQFLGDEIGTVGYTNVFETFGPKSLSKEVSETLNYDVGGSLGPSGAAGKPGDRSVPFLCGPHSIQCTADESTGR